MDTAFSSSDHTIEGVMRTGGQEHFYLETNVCIAIPGGENGEMELIASAQCLADMQRWAAKALGVDANKVIGRIKRIGMCNNDRD